MNKEPITKMYSLDSLLSNNLAEEIRGMLGKDKVFLKDERMNPTGSHKDRSFRPWIKKLEELGVKEAVVSSSGNSAISAAYFTRTTKIRLIVYISKNVAPEKMRRLESNIHPGVRLQMSDAPKKDAFLYAKESGSYFLRASTDDLALEGYRDIAFEIKNQLDEVDAVIIPTSSGATCLGMSKGFEEERNGSSRLPKFFIVQTSSVHPISEVFDARSLPEEKSLATSIVDKVAHRRDEVIACLRRTGGGAFTVTNAELKQCAAWLAPTEKSFGYESLLTLSALTRLELKTMKRVVCLCTS